jgi:hypothetical protein
MVYTGVTLGKRLMVVVGQRKALAIAVKGARPHFGRREGLVTFTFLVLGNVVS